MGESAWRKERLLLLRRQLRGCMGLDAIKGSGRGALEAWVMVAARRLLARCSAGAAAWMTDEAMKAVYECAGEAMLHAGRAVAGGVVVRAAERPPNIVARALDIYMAEHRGALKEVAQRKRAKGKQTLYQRWRKVGCQRWKGLSASERAPYMAMMEASPEYLLGFDKHTQRRSRGGAQELKDAVAELHDALLGEQSLIEKVRAMQAHWWLRDTQCGALRRRAAEAPGLP